SRFTPGSDTIAVAGSFTGWAGGAIPCTNDPAAANTNIYTAVIPILDNVGTGEQYKFITYGPGINGTDYESPASGGNRAFDLPGSNTNLPVVFFSDHVLSDILTSDVTVVFTVEMTNAVGTDLVSWSPSVPVYINGDFLGWPKWTTLLPQMTEGDGGSSLYAYTNVFAAGSPVIVNYKYGMNAVDDEAPSGQNHARYIRGYGTYYMPVDKFGTQLTESSFGNLAVKPPSGGHIPISWLGRPGVHLQTRTNLTTGAWVDHPETDALSATNWPFTGSSQYFRLIHPL
ncbi:MAG: hypothetical protein JWQ04_567, partial [Pedosphaera sp.]|nr:hypothetical protein [Pedosphaera sp.]